MRLLTDDVDLLRSYVTRSRIRVSACEAMKGQARLKGLSFSLRQDVTQWWTLTRLQIGEVVHQAERINTTHWDR